MALAVDKFELLFVEVMKTVTCVRDSLAIIGLCYASKKTISITWSLLKAFRTHGIARFTAKDLKQRFGGSWAVVTGCTQGIGEAYVKQLAEAGLNVCLVSRNPDKLYTLKNNVESEYGVSAEAIAVDFRDGPTVYEELKDRLQVKDIGILVNNVGVMYDYPDYFLKLQEDKLWQLIDVNITAATMMTHMVLPQMVDRGSGAIIVVTAGTSIRPMPQMTVYSATKAYLDYFARALSYEYGSKGITVQCLKPFYVATRMTRYSTTLSKPSLWIPTASEYVRQAINTIGWSNYTTGYWPHTIQLWLSSMIPEWLWFWGSSRLNAAFRRQAQQRIRRRSYLVSESAGQSPQPSPRSGGIPPLLPPPSPHSVHRRHQSSSPATSSTATLGNVRLRHRSGSPLRSPRSPTSRRNSLTLPPPHSLSMGALSDARF